MYRGRVWYRRLRQRAALHPPQLPPPHPRTLAGVERPGNCLSLCGDRAGSAGPPAAASAYRGCELDPTRSNTSVRRQPREVLGCPYTNCRRTFLNNRCKLTWAFTFCAAKAPARWVRSNRRSLPKSSTPRYRGIGIIACTSSTSQRLLPLKIVDLACIIIATVCAARTLSRRLLRKADHTLRSSKVFAHRPGAGLERVPDRCYLQITGIYTFPDYLDGKTFLDLRPHILGKI